MKAKKILVPVLMSLITSSGLTAQTQSSVINEMNVDTEAYSYEGKSFYTADIDSIVFLKAPWTYGTPGETYKLMRIRGNGMGGNGMSRAVDFPVSEIKGIEFTFCDSRKLYAPKFTGNGIVESGKGNSLNVSWEPVEGASGYELKYCCFTGAQNAFRGSVDCWGNGDFERWLEGTHPESVEMPELPADGGVLTLKAETVDTVIEGLRYGCAYAFAVRALSAVGEEFNSDWSIRSDIGRCNNFTMYTQERYNVPNVLAVDSRDETSVRIGFNLSYAAHKDEDIDEDFAKNFEIVDGNFVADELRVQGKGGAKVDEKWTNYKLTAQDIENGYVDVTGLDGASYYYVTLANSRIASVPDACYNGILITTKGNRAPIVIKHEANELTEGYEACDINSTIKNFMTDGRYDNQIFYLEGGKAYYLSTQVPLCKGITLETLPEDVAAGKRAKVYMGGIPGVEYTMGCIFMLTTPDFCDKLTESHIEPITFRNIDFDCPDALNYGAIAGGSGSSYGNYFVNCNVNHGPFVLESLNIEGCTFQGIIRGFVRMQGVVKTEIKSINCDGNLFYNCGYYSPTGSGYGWFYSDRGECHNIYSDFRFVNNTIYDSPNSSLVSSGNRRYTLGADVKWNITIEHNTFINFSTRKTGLCMINMRYVPAGSHFSVQRNLFALAKHSDTDSRTLYNCGADIRTSDITYEIKDNYSTGCLDSHLVDDGIFTSAAFSATRSSFGAFPDGNLGTADDLKVKVGSTPLKTDELFANPNPPYDQVEGAYSPNDHKAPENIMEALKYKQTPEVLNHEIYTKNIGDQRWKK